MTRFLMIVILLAGCASHPRAESGPFGSGQSVVCDSDGGSDDNGLGDGDGSSGSCIGGDGGPSDGGGSNN